MKLRHFFELYFGQTTSAGLPVGGTGSVLAEVVAVKEALGDAGVPGDQSEGSIGHAGYGFEDYRVVGGVLGVLAPAERGVAGYEDGGDGKWVDSLLLEVVDDGKASLVNVTASDGLVGEAGRHWDGAVEVVGVGGAKGGDRQARLREAGCVLRVGVDHRANAGEFAVEQRMGIEVGGRLQRAVDDLAVQVGYDPVLRPQDVVVDSRRLDDDEPLLAIDAAGVAEGVEDQATFDEFEVGFKDSGSQLFQQHGFPSPSCKQFRIYFRSLRRSYRIDDSG